MGQYFDYNEVFNEEMKQCIINENTNERRLEINIQNIGSNGHFMKLHLCTWKCLLHHCDRMYPQKDTIT